MTVKPHPSAQPQLEPACTAREDGASSLAAELGLGLAFVPDSVADLVSYNQQVTCSVVPLFPHL